MWRSSRFAAIGAFNLPFDLSGSRGIPVGVGGHVMRVRLFSIKGQKDRQVADPILFALASILSRGFKAAFYYGLAFVYFFGITLPHRSVSGLETLAWARQ